MYRKCENYGKFAIKIREVKELSCCRYETIDNVNIAGERSVHKINLVMK